MNQPITLEMIREKLFSAVVCDALDSLGFKHQSPRLPMNPITVETILVGRCKTTLWSEMYHSDPEPYKLELQAIDSLSPDDVFIAAAGGSTHSGIWGELLSTAATHRGCRGAIVDGAVRDIRQMKKMGFPVWAQGACIYDSKDRNRVIDIDVPVEIEGVVFSPGDLVIADVDGIVVVPQEVEEEAINLAWQKVHDENEFRESIKNGMSVTEAFEKYGVL